jgi:hypothetical protein
MGRIWDEAKNISLLLKAAEKIPWPVYIAGEHNGMDKIICPKCNVVGSTEPEGGSRMAFESVALCTAGKI